MPGDPQKYGKLKKAFKIARKVLGYFLLAILLVVLLAGGLIHTPFFQKFLADKAAVFLSDYMACEVSVVGADINFWKRSATLRGIQILDKQSNPTVYIEQADAVLATFNAKKIALQSAALRNPQIIIRRYEGDSQSDFKRVLAKIAARPKKDTSLRKAFIIENMRVEDGRFLYDAEDVPAKPAGQVDFKHVALEKVQLEARNFYTRCGVVMAKIDHLEGEEKSGMVIKDFSSQVFVDKGRMRYTSTRIRTPESRLSLDLDFKAKDWKRYKNFVEEVRLGGNIQSSTELALSDLARFVPALEGLSAKLRLSSRFRGPISRLDVQSLNLSTGDSTRLDGKVLMENIGTGKEEEWDLSLGQLKTNRNDLENMALFQAFGWQVPPVLHPLTDVDLSGTFSGSFKRFEADLRLQTNLGDLRFVNHSKDSTQGRVYMQGELQARNVGLGQMLRKEDLLGDFDLQTRFSLFGRDFSSMTYDLDGKVQCLEFAGRRLYPLYFDLFMEKDFFAGNMVCHDPDFDFDLAGIVDFRSDSSRTRYNLDLRNINLTPLHLMGDTGYFAARTRVSVDHRGNEAFAIYGDVLLKDTKIQRLGAVYSLDSLSVSVAHAGSVGKQVRVRSDLLDLDARGIWNISATGKELERFLAYYLPERVEKVPVRDSTSLYPEFELSLRLSNPDSLLAVFFPAWSLPLGMEAELAYNSRLCQLALDVDLPYIQSGSVALMRNGLHARSDSSGFFAQEYTGSLSLDDSIRLDDFGIRVGGTQKDEVDYRIAWGGEGQPGPSSSVSSVPVSGSKSKTASLEGKINFLPQDRIRVGLSDCMVGTGRDAWRNFPGGYVLIAKDSLHFENFGMYAENSSDGIWINGDLSRDPMSSLRLDFSAFDISYFDYFLRRAGMDMDGEINGYAEIKDFYKQFLFKSDLVLGDMQINGTPYGWAELSASFSREDAVRARLQIKENPSPDSVSRLASPRTSFSLEGAFYPKKGKKLEFEGFASHLPVAFMNRILGSVAKDLQGHVDGEFQVGGSLPDFRFDARFRSDSLAATIPVLETRYVFNNLDFRLNPEGIEFLSGNFIDPLFQTRGELGGKIAYRNFKDIRLDLDLNFNNLLALNTGRSLDMPFWGTVFATGSLGIEGPVSDISLLLNARVDDNSDITFDFSSAGGNTGSNFITFLEKKPDALPGEIPLESFYVRNKARYKPNGKLTLDLNLVVTPGLAVKVGIHNTSMSGNLQATGDGVLRLYMPGGNPQLFGTYTIAGGTFDFSMVNLINRKFDLEEGGTISWIGPMADARVNIRAGYQTKASLYPVLASLGVSAEEESQLKQNANVKSIIVLTGNLMNPDIGFDIDLINTDEDTRDRFFSVIKKDDEDEMLRQTFSLLMFNSFMAVESSSSASAGNAALTSSSDFIFSQFNNFLSNFTSDFNLGLNYRPGDVNTNSEFEVTMSGQLFDDRLVINGNLGVSDRQGANAGANTVVGDVDVEWKFTEELRLRGFNHSNDQDLTKPANSYTQGVGIVFRRNFDNWQEFLHGTTPRRTKEERKAERRKNREIRQMKRQQQKGR